MQHNSLFGNSGTPSETIGFGGFGGTPSGLSCAMTTNQASFVIGLFGGQPNMQTVRYLGCFRVWCIKHAFLANLVIIDLNREVINSLITNLIILRVNFVLMLC